MKSRKLPMAETISRRGFIRVMGTSLAALGTVGVESCRAKRAKVPKNAQTYPALKKELDGMRAELKLLKKNLVKVRKARGEFGPLASQFAKKQRVYRLHHIASGELRGKKRNQIERPHDGNAPNEAEIAKIKKRYGAG